MKTLILLTAMIGTMMSTGAKAQGALRYKEKVFTEVAADTNIQYASNINVNKQKQDLHLDIYQPKDDTLTKRPVIIFMHGGAFMAGSRKDYYVVDFCKEFAKRGYVTVSPTYRLGIENLFDLTKHGEAIYRATQDMRAAVRFFQANAQKYNIDPDMIFIGGGSAGAIAALHAAYWDQSEVPSYLSASKLGTLSDAGGNAGYSEKVAGVINCWGAIIDTNWIKSGNAPVVSIHGEKDSVVPYKSYTFMGYSLYGSYYIHERAKELGITTELKSFPNGGHGLAPNDTASWNTSLRVLNDFLYKLVSDTQKVITNVEVGQKKETYGWKVYADASAGSITVVNGSPYPIRKLVLYDMQGRLYRSFDTTIPAAALHQESSVSLPAGQYILQVHFENGGRDAKKVMF